MIWGALLPLLGVVIGGVTTTPTTTTATSINDIESYVKNLEYEAYGGDVSHNGGRGEAVVINLNLLPDEVLAEDIDQGVQEDFQVVDAEQGDTTLDKAAELANKTRSRQLSLIYQGVYAPDSRFNAFVDGVMVNMVAEMKRKRMDPLYFRVYDRGIVEHVSARAGREEAPTPSPADSLADSSPPTESETTQSSRTGRQRGSAIGGGVIRGLTNVKRFGNAEVQIAGNTTLVRSHYVYGPLNIELLFNTEQGVKSINSTLSALAAHAVTHVNDSSAALIDFLIDSPSSYEINLEGEERNERFNRLSHSAITRLFKPFGRLEKRLNRVYIRARSRRVPNVIRQARRRNRNQNGGGNGGGRRNGGRNGTNRSNDENSTNNGSQGEPIELP